MRIDCVNCDLKRRQSRGLSYRIEKEGEGEEKVYWASSLIRKGRLIKKKTQRLEV